MTTATKQAQHTPGPWRVHSDGLAIFAANSEQVLDCTVCSPNLSDAEQKANAAFIVRACNAHDDLLAALRQIVADVGDYFGEFPPEINGSTFRLVLATIAKAES